MADVIRQLRNDLNYAAWQGEGQDLQFELGPIELEFAVVVDTARAGHAGARLWVVDVGAERNRSTQTTHRVRLTLNPTDASGRRTSISGRALAGEEMP